MEIWKEIKGYEGYYSVSNKARVRNDKTGYIKKDRPNIDGYLTVELCMNGDCRNKMVHRLVAIAFIPNPDNYLICGHIDDNPSNPLPENLTWCTQSQNIRKAFDSGRKSVAIGSNCSYSKLKESDVLEIMKSLNKRERIFQIVKRYPVSRGMIYKIKKRTAWKHVPWPEP